MRKGNIGSLLFTLLFAVMAYFFLLPSFKLYRMSPEEQKQAINEDPSLRSKIINLGLDIQGGMRIVLELDTADLPEDQKVELRKDEHLIDKAYTIIENRINSMGLTEPTIQKVGRERIVVDFPGLNDEESARNMMQSTAQLNFHIVREDDEYEQVLRRIDRVLSGEVDRSASTAEVAKTSTDVERDELDDLLAVDPVDEEEEVAQTPTGRVFQLSEMMEQGHFRQNERLLIDSLLALPSVQAVMRHDTRFLWSNAPLVDRQRNVVRASNGANLYRLYLVTARPAMSGDNLRRASVFMDQGFPKVSLEFNPQGAKDFANVTGRNVNRQMAIVLDNTVYSAPNINQRIAGGRASIEGSFTRDEARQLSVVLEAGRMPVDLKIIQETKVGATIGQAAVNRAVIAFAIGFSFIFIFMIAYYKLSGLLAVTALLLNVLFVLAIMASFGATLTLPGIAGLILIMGMSVDANVIVFERIKEELAAGKSVVKAIDAGYSRAFVSIVDANVTTLFTAIILASVGSGPIRGFAITLIYGIFVSLFTALSFTRMVYHFVLDSRKPKTLSI